MNVNPFPNLDSGAKPDPYLRGSTGETNPETSSPETSSVANPTSRGAASEPEQPLDQLRQEEQRLRQEIAVLQADAIARCEQLAESQMTIGRLVKEGLTELEQRKQTLQIAVEQLERRQERIKAEMRTSFAGASQDLAIRVQGFKDYLVGSLQDLASAAEQLELPVKSIEVKSPATPVKESVADAPSLRFAQQGFQDEAKQIRRLLDQYRASPDYYGSPWRLRRTFEPIHADRVSNWFFNQGGRGSMRTLGSRLQNILVASATISVLRELHGDRLRTLVLADAPERLGEWRRGLQDCLGISRTDFGANEGIVLFEAPDPLAQRAERLAKQKQLPFIIIDETEDDRISLSLLQFPLWLAIAADPTNPTLY